MGNLVKFWQNAEEQWTDFYRHLDVIKNRGQSRRYRLLANKAHLQAEYEQEKLNNMNHDEMVRVGTHGRKVKKNSLK